MRSDLTDNLQGTISVVSHDHGPLLRALLGDLSDQHGIDAWHILVTLNIPEPLDVTEFPKLRLTIIRNSQPLGFGANHNAAARAAGGQLLLIVNPDIRLPDRDALVRIAGLRWDLEPAALRAPIVVAPDGSVEDSVRANLSPLNLLRRRRRSTSGWDINPTDPVFFWLAGMFLIAPLDAFLRIGGFDERFRLYCEDYDLSARWRIAGGNVEIVPDLRVIHDARRDSHKSWRHMRWHLASLARVWTSAPFWRIVIHRHPRAPGEPA